MMKCLLGLVVVTLPLAAEDKKPDDTKAKLQGKWNVAAMEADGKALPENEFGLKWFTFEGDKVTAKRDDDSKPGTFKVDDTQKPPELDFTADGKTTSLKMIYKLDGDTLTLYIGKSEAIRPKTYDDAALIVTLKRDKK